MDEDAIIVGAGPSGCAAAYDLACAGRSVLLLDHRAFPRVKPCGGGLTFKALRALRYPVWPVVRRVCARMRLSRNLSDPRALIGQRPFCAMTVRSEFDDFCLRRTLERGARFQRIGRLRSVSESDDRVTIETDAGSWSAPYVIGADGVNSRARALMASRPVAPGPALAIETDVVVDAGTMPEMTFDFGVVPRGYGWLFPRDDHVNVGLYTMDGQVALTRALLRDYVEARLPGARVEKLVGYRMGIGGARWRPSSDRVLLVGDAAGLVEPLMGEGLAHAIESGQAAAAAIERALRGDAPARQVYHELLRPIQRDLRSVARWAWVFHRWPRLGHEILTFPPIARGLLEGYARGLRFKTVRKRWWSAPFWPAPDREVVVPLEVPRDLGAGVDPARGRG